jgi:glyoxylase-like metal-dependent hydrolase (beta-lactamase superfamily II)
MDPVITEFELGKTRKVEMEDYDLALDVRGLKLTFVNAYFIGSPGDYKPWVLIDAGLYGSAKNIIEKAEQLYGKDNPPQAIVLTHGHFDHVGALPKLLDYWPRVRVYAHAQEIPFLTGQYQYPAPDPGVGGGAMAAMSWMYPRKPINIRGRVLPIASKMSFLEDWEVIHTPGHTPGHISLFRKKDGVLIAGDALSTTNQNSLTSVIKQEKVLHGPPSYYTINWQQAKKSVFDLSNRMPKAVGAGHGLPMFDNELYIGLERLKLKFESSEIPSEGHYTQMPVEIDDDINNYPVPEAYHTYKRYTIAGLFSAAIIIGAAIYAFNRK